MKKSKQYPYRQYFIIVFVFAPFLFLLSTQSGRAQDIRDSKGKEFWLTFLPNYHNEPGNLEDSLYIFITAEQPASGTIQYFDNTGKSYSTPFSIGKDEFFIFSKVFRDFELSGYNTIASGTFLNQSETAVPQAFKVTSTTDVTVYGLNQARTTSDAFIGLPSDVLGQQYMIMSYPTDNDTPSQFAILATKNNTQVTITPTAPTSETNSANPQTVSLNQGEVYLVQARLNRADLTGTKITSTQPIAVFSGHQRATIPNPSSLISRDHLVEQLPPIPTWGGSAFVTPYPLAQDANPNEFDVYRVMAANDNTKVYIDGVFNRTLASGKFYDTELRESEWITATGPILVAQFKKSSNEQGQQNFSKTGDPFMIINSPTEQYLKRFHCFNIKAWERDNSQTPIPVYDNEQYITIIVPTDSLATVKLDGKLIDPKFFKTLSITSYSYTDSLRVETGIHTIESNAKMGVYVYGYGAANSYGYIGGMGYDTIYTFDPPDIIPPLILGSASCGLFKGGAFDTLSFDRGIKSIDKVPGEIINANVSLGAVVSPAASVPFTAQLIDPFQDGRIAVVAYDSSGGHRKSAFDIPGFTVRALLSTGTDIPGFEEKTNLNTPKCISVEMTNYGKFQQTITGFSFLKNTPHYSVSTPLPFTLAPGQKRVIDVCLDATVSGVFKDTLVISTPCIERQVAALAIKVRLPLLKNSATDCFTVRGSFYDTLIAKKLIQNVAPIPGSLNNVTVNINPQAPIPGWDSLSFVATLVDPYFDGSGAIRTVDDEDEVISFEIPGFTIHPDPVDFKTIEINEEIRAKRQICFPVVLKNYGKFPQVISGSSFKSGGTEFSITPSTLNIAPGASGTVNVCFFFNDAATFNDSLIIKNDCISRSIAYFALTAIKDTVKPSLTRSSDPCELQDNVAFKDDLKFDWGIKSFTIAEQVNATIDIDSSALPNTLAFTARSIDRRSDARYRIKVVDSADNIRDTTLIIQGFTLNILGLGNGIHQFDSAFNHSPFCDSISIYNSSELPFVLENAALLGNIYFSAPLSQFPLTIPPKDTGILLVCFEAGQYRDYADSISLKKYCIEEIIGLQGSKKDEILSGNSQCDVRLQLSSKTIPGRPFIQKSFPNPADDFTTLRFGITQSGPVNITLYDDRGNEAAVFTNAHYAPGIYELEVGTGTFKSGQYYYKFTAGDVVEVNTFTIVH